MSEAQYPPDEFDRIGKSLPQGSHRPGQPWWQGFLPFVFVIIAAPLLAWAVLLLVGSGANAGHPQASPSASQSQAAEISKLENTADSEETAQPPASTAPSSSPSAAPSSAPSGTDTTTPATQTTPTSQATPSPSKSKEVDKAVKVTVYNATGINGLAAGVKKDIATQGFTQITATNFSGTKPAQNTIYFHPDFRAEAEIIQHSQNPVEEHHALRPWAAQGVMLLNRVLTVQSGKPASHRGRGWEEITAHAIAVLARRDNPLVAILWGNDARQVKPLLGRIPVIESAHPSPLSASRGFFGSRPFSRANAMLKAAGAQTVDWALP